ncbi:PREDICTED: uncharacterized protein LOC108771854 [Cyphomyrmex costatus]|uniref:uncharacterized protein LOC108771854 n=1 Tax=Cyphomyrmex costatus TaxID=456900 RepID=UPI0008523DDE|nr:PREDICTED: uncharacterized protein LOC108771854 [Cyphomyrmex costatus]
MEAIIESQVELYGRIARTHENLRKSGAEKLTKVFVSTTLGLLDAKWQKFEAQHERLRDNYLNDLKKHEYYLKDFMGQAEEVYTHQRAMLVELEDSMSGKAAKEEMKVNMDATTSPGTTLPRLQIPQFSGKYEDWPAYRDLFSSLFVKNSYISDVTKMHYLKTILKGDAELLIKNLPTTENNFSLAWQSLTDHYENTRLLVRSFYATLLALPKLKSESATDLRKLFHCARNTAGALANIGRPITNGEDLYVCRITDLLDPRTRARWEEHIDDKTLPSSFTELQEFLERRLLTLEVISGSKVDENPGKASGSKVARAHHAQKERERCALCHKDYCLMMCEAFKKKTCAERKQFIDSAKLCVNCLGKHKHSVKVSAIVLPRLTLYASVSSTSVRDWPHLRGLELADPEFCASDSINILLGADVLAEIIGSGIKKRGPYKPITQQTDLG